MGIMSAHDDVMEDRGLEGLSWFVAVSLLLVGGLPLFRYLT